MRKAGFTLVEILAVLALMGLMAAVVGLSLSGRQRLADRAEMIDRIKAFDSRARELAETSADSLAMIFDLSSQSITARKEDGSGPISLSLPISQTARLTELRVFGRLVTNGSIMVPLSHQGATPTYALSLVDLRGEKERFLVVGLTGQIIKVANEEQLQDILRLAKGPDAP